MRILIVEDDERTAATLTSLLQQQHYVFDVANDGEMAWDHVQTFDYDLAIIDVLLPKLDGLSLCQRIRSHNYHLPILVLTARNTSQDKAKGLDAGADDYVVKPFDAEELAARIRALLRRGQNSGSPILTWGDLQLIPSHYEVTFQDQPIGLTPKEYALLELLLRHPQRVFSCGAILEHLWSVAETPGEDTVRTHIKGLRQKLKAAGAPADLVETVYGIGYRLKAEPDPLTDAGADQSAPLPSAQIALAGLWDRFAESVRADVEILEEAAMAVKQGNLSVALQQAAEHTAHVLTGLLGSFGFSKGSRLANKIEQLVARQSFHHPEQIRRLQQLVKGLRHEIEQTPVRLASQAAVAPNPQKHLLIVDQNPKLADALKPFLQGYDMESSLVSDPHQLQSWLEQRPPHLILLDPSWTGQLEDGLTLLRSLAQTIPSVPVIVHTDQDSLASRAEIVRLGARAFIHKPATPEMILDVILRVVQQLESLVARVLVVDDDPQTLLLLKTLLEPWGLQVTTLADPAEFWQVLETILPDLVLLDVKMPQISGIELCQIVRNDAQWSQLPIIALTTLTDAATINQVFAAGADDFVSKPIVGPELIARIMQRLERIQLLRSLAETDPLTRLANRHKSTQDLNRYLLLAQDHQQRFCLALLDLDHFKDVNDRYGHAAGDEVLSRFGQILHRSFQGEDVIGRWGGEEFVVGMYGMSQSDALLRLQQVLDLVREIEFTCPAGDRFQVSFSAGVAEYPTEGTDLQTLYRAADQALYQAKTAGRSQVMGGRSTHPQSLSQVQS